MTRSLRRPKFAAIALTLLLLAGGAAVQAQSPADKAARFYEDALRRYDKRDMAGAIIQLKNALQIDKNQLSVHVLLGKAMLANGDVDGAEFEFNEALRLGVNRAEVAVPLAQSLLAQGKQQQIFEQQRLNVAGLPADVKLQLLLVRASAASDLGDVRGAMQAIQDARSIGPADPASWLAEVPIRIRARQFPEGLAAADQAIKLAPDSAEAHYQKASLLHVQGQTKTALELYDKALKIDGGHIEARLARAGMLLDQGRDKDVQADLRELRMLAPSEPRSTYLRALLAERAGDAAGAKAALKEVTELLDPVPLEFIRYRPQALILNGMAHFGLREFEKAKPYLELAQRLQPNSPLSKLLAQIALAEPNFGRAGELLESYLKIQPGDGQAMLMLASVHMAQGRHQKATLLMQEALRAKDAPEFRTALGLSLMGSGQNTSAVTELEKSFRSDPRQTYAGLALVDLHLRSGRAEQAVAVVNSLVKINPDNAGVLLVQGMAKAAQRDYAGARSAYEMALKRDDKLTEARLGLARVDIAIKAFDAARQRLAEMLRNDGRHVDTLFEMAVLHEVWGKPDEALKWLESAAEASSHRETRANFALVAWHLRKGLPAKALEAARLLLAKLPEDVAALQAYAGAEMANGDLAGARNTLTSASRRAAFEAPAQVEIARAQIQAQDLPGAYYSLDKALSAAPDFLPAMVLMTVVELRQNESTKAERRAQQIIQSHPKLAVGHGLLADVALSRGQSGAAIVSLRRAHELEQSSQTLLRLFEQLAEQDGGKPAIALAEAWVKTHPRDLAALKSLGNLHARNGVYPSARRFYEAALKLSPGDTEALNNLANVLIRQRDPTALQVAERALGQSPRSSITLDTAGWANHIAGNKDRALQLLRDARLREPNNPQIRYHLAAVLAKAGRDSEARQELIAALRSADFENIQDAKHLLTTLK